MIWLRDEQGRIHATKVFTIAHQGPPMYVHGGASAAVLDEAMGAAIWSSGYSVVAVNLEINYKKPVPLGVEMTILAEIVEVLPRKILTRSEIRLVDGTVAVTGRGIYVKAPHLFKDMNFESFNFD